MTSVAYETLTENRGTKSYMAPEQVIILLYYCLCLHLHYLHAFHSINSVLVVFDSYRGIKPSCLMFPDMTVYEDNLILKKAVSKCGGFI